MKNFSLHSFLLQSRDWLSEIDLCENEFLQSKKFICFVQNHLLQRRTTCCNTYSTPLEGKEEHCKVQHIQLNFTLLRVALKSASFNQSQRSQRTSIFCWSYGRKYLTVLEISVFVCGPFNDVESIWLSWKKVTLHAPIRISQHFPKRDDSSWLVWSLNNNKNVPKF